MLITHLATEHQRDRLARAEAARLAAPLRHRVRRTILAAILLMGS